MPSSSGYTFSWNHSLTDNAYKGTTTTSDGQKLPVVFIKLEEKGKLSVPKAIAKLDNRYGAGIPKICGVEEMNGESYAVFHFVDVLDTPVQAIWTNDATDDTAVLKAICQALKPLHDNFVAHQNLTFENTHFVQGQGSAPAVWFSGLRMMSVIGPNGTVNADTNVLTAAPEQFRKMAQKEGTCDLKSDMWSIGHVFYEYLTGKKMYKPLSEAKKPELLEQIVQDQILTVDVIMEDIHKKRRHCMSVCRAWARVIKSLLNPIASMRPDINTLISTLEAFDYPVTVTTIPKAEELTIPYINQSGRPDARLDVLKDYVKYHCDIDANKQAFIDITTRDLADLTHDQKNSLNRHQVELCLNAISMADFSSIKCNNFVVYDTNTIETRREQKGFSYVTGEVSASALANYNVGVKTLLGLVSDVRGSLSTNFRDLTIETEVIEAACDASLRLIDNFRRGFEHNANACQENHAVPPIATEHFNADGCAVLAQNLLVRKEKYLQLFQQAQKNALEDIEKFASLHEQQHINTDFQDDNHLPAEETKSLHALLQKLKSNGPLGGDDIKADSCDSLFNVLHDQACNYYDVLSSISSSFFQVRDCRKALDSLNAHQDVARTTAVELLFLNRFLTSREELWRLEQGEDLGASVTRRHPRNELALT